MSQAVKTIKLNFPYTTYGLSYIEKLFSIYELNDMPNDYRLSSKEKIFFFNLVNLYNKGIDLKSLQATKELQKIRGVTAKNRGVYLYKSILKKKKWLQETAEGRLEIPPFFKKGSSTIKFDINLNYV